MSIKYGGVAFGKVQMPRIVIKGTTRTYVRMDLTIINRTAFDHFGKAMMDEQYLEWGISGHINVKLLFVVFKKIYFEKTMQLGGFNKLRDVSITEFDMIHSTKQNIIVNLIVQIMNPCNITISNLGTIQFQVYYKHESLGTISTTETVEMKLGKNVMHLRGHLEPSNIEIANELISRFFTGKPSYISAIAPQNSSTVPLLSPALSGLNLTTILQGPSINLMKSIKIVGMSLIPINNEEVVLSETILVDLLNPLGNNSTLHIVNISLDAAIYWNTLKIGTIKTPPTSVRVVEKNQILVNISSGLHFEDSGKNLATFLEHFLNSEEIKLTFIGKTSAHAIVPIGPVFIQDLVFNNTVVLKGMDGIKNTSIVNFTLPGNADRDGVVIDLYASMYDPSVASFDIGLVEFNVVYDNVVMGVVNVSELIIDHGINTVNMNGIMNPENLDIGSIFFSNYLKGKPSPVSVSGKRTFRDISWMESLIKNMHISTVLPGAKNITLISGVNLESLGLKFRPGELPLMNGTAEAFFNFPNNFLIPWNIFSLKINLLMLVNNSKMLDITIPYIPCDGNNTSKKAVFSIENARVNIQNTSLFEDFLVVLFLHEQVQLKVQGISSGKVATNMGNITIIDVPFSSELSLKGMNHFAPPDITITKVDLNAATKDTLIFVLDLQITNPSSAFLDSGWMALQIYFDDKFIGNGSMPSFAIKLGKNVFHTESTIFVDPSNEVVIRKLLSNYMNGVDQQVIVKGTEDCTHIPYLKKAISLLSTVSAFPGLSERMIEYAHVEFSSHIWEGQVYIEIYMINPFNLDMDIIGIDLDIYDQDTKIGYIRHDLTNDPIQVPAKQKIIAHPVILQLIKIDAKLIETLWTVLPINTKGKVKVILDQAFTFEADYVQDNIPTSFNKPS
eukprot:TRINITY_DN7437_c0_g1_i2.p1 TRINITY_DN7437_c0_g1~~TRINITY_DN7437_c0_g1_i2.p1  ORF type:complete len:1016 (-),score=181.67 TRINITY_DN7437_c0_g1_i2:85-2781(-)